jgi:unsaturated rhamnogalacturonyl hydrolase
MKINDSNTHLHLLKARYPIPYQVPKKKNIIKKLLRILTFLEKVTPSYLINKKNKKVSNKSAINADLVFPESAFRLTSYEWGVTYAGLLKASEITGIGSFSDHALKRLKMISILSNYYLAHNKVKLDKQSPIYPVLHPAALDDSGAICAAMIKAQQLDSTLNLTPMIDNLIDYISNKQFRFNDGAFARNRPYKNTLWLDDLFMSVPALAIYGKSVSKSSYIDDAANQIILFSNRMFVREKGLYFHGYVNHMDIHPKFYWARANGWAVMAAVELLSILPEDHKNYNIILEQFKLHVEGLLSYQSADGLWHQLLDRNDSYLETSASAIITYSIAKAINERILEKSAFAPALILAWNALSAKINNDGKIKGICVGTGMGFDEAFYYYRPTNIFAAHGYGPMFLAGAEIIHLIDGHTFELVEGSIQLKD